MQPIINPSDTLYKPIYSKIFEIEKVLSSIEIEQDSLYTGKAGIAVFYANLYELTKDKTYLDKAIELIDDAVDAIQSKELIYTYCSGFTGICWALQYFVNKGYVDIDINEILEDIDQYAFDFAKNDFINWQYDFMHAGLSTGIYFTDRPNSPFAQEKLKEIVILVKSIANKAGNGIAWEDKTSKHYTKTYIPDYDLTKTEYNLGLSHGIPSIITFLQRCVQQGILLEESKPLLEASLTWLMEQAYPDNKDCYYGTKVIEGSDKQELSRLAWCYGDLGIMTTLWQGGVTLQNEAIKQHAIDIALKAAKRTFENSTTADAGICHGAAGIAHIFNRMYQHTQRNELKIAANFWFDHALKYATYPDGYAGYKTYHGEDHGGYTNEAGMLEGIAGIGLAMISALDGNLEWDRMLLIS